MSGQHHRSAQRLGAAVAETSDLPSGPVEWHAFLSKWGAAPEIEAHRSDVADLARWWLDRDGDGSPVVEHLSAVLERLDTLCATAHRAEAALADVGYRFDPGDRVLRALPSGKRGTGRLLFTDLIVAASTEGRGRYSKANFAKIRSRFGHLFPPEDLTDARIKATLKNHLGDKPVRARRRK